MQLLQLRQHRAEIAIAYVRHPGDPGPWQGVVVGALAELVGVHAQRIGDVRHHALVLGAAAVGAEELGDGQLDLAVARSLAGGRPAVQVEQVLHRALAEGGLADHQAAPVVLHRPGKDLRGRGRAAVDQHRQRTVPGHARRAIAVHLHAPTRFALLHHRALVDEQAAQLHRLVQRAAAVVAQVHHHPVHALGLELAQQARHVAGGRGVVVAVAAAPLEVLVEGRQFDHPDQALGRVALGRDRVGLALGGLLGQLHAGTGQGHAAVFAVDATFGRDVFQLDLGALVATDPGDHVVDAPADHVLDHAGLALADADDAVAGLEGAVQRRRAAGDDLADHHEIILPLQLGTNALQRQRHGLVEVLGAARIEVVGVRIDRRRVGIEEQREHVLALELVHRARELRIALVQGPADLGRLLAGDLQPQPVVHHRLAPQRVQLGRVGGPGRVFAVIVPALVATEVEVALFQQLARIGHPLLHPLAVDGEHGEGRGRIALAHRLAQLVPVGVEAGDVGGGEELAVAVQRLDVAAEDIPRQRLVGRARAIGQATVRKRAIDHPGDRGLVGGGRERHLVPAVRARQQGKRQGQQEGGEQRPGSGDFAVHSGLVGRRRAGGDRLHGECDRGQCRKLQAVRRRSTAGYRSGPRKGERNRAGTARNPCGPAGPPRPPTGPGTSQLALATPAPAAWRSAW